MKSNHPDLPPPSPAIEQRVTDFLNRLTLEEKIDLLGGEPDGRYVALTDGVFFGYRHHDRTGLAPLFPFGFGLSYTTFAYENLVLPERLGIPGQVRAPQVLEAIDRVAEACRRHGKQAGIPARDAADAAGLMEKGFRFFTTGADFCFVRDGLLQTKEAFGKVGFTFRGA